MMEDWQSIISALQLPSEFGKVLLIFSFILLIAPYFYGLDFGIFKVPAFSEKASKVLKIVGPFIFLFSLLLFVPLLGKNSVALAKSPLPIPITIPKDVKEIFESYVPHSWYSIYSLKDYSQFDSTTLKKELAERNVIIFNTIPYNLSINTDKDALAFFALNYSLQNSTPETNLKKLAGLKLGHLFKKIQYWVIVNNEKENSVLQYKNTIAVKIDDQSFDVNVQVIFLSRNASVKDLIFPTILKEMQKDPMTLLITDYKPDKVEELVQLILVE